jgi:hypothetical protein
MLKPPARRSFPNNGDRELSALTPGKNFKARVGFSRITITTQSNFILANFEITANVCRLHPTSDSFNWKLLQHVIQIVHCTTCNNLFSCLLLCKTSLLLNVHILQSLLVFFNHGNYNKIHLIPVLINFKPPLRIFLNLFSKIFDFFNCSLLLLHIFRDVCLQPREGVKVCRFGQPVLSLLQFYNIIIQSSFFMHALLNQVAVQGIA